MHLYIILSFNCKILFSISLITILYSSSDFPVGSSNSQLSSNALPIKGQPTLHPIEIAISGLGISEINFEYCVCYISIAYNCYIYCIHFLSPHIDMYLCILVKKHIFYTKRCVSYVKSMRQI